MSQEPTTFVTSSGRVVKISTAEPTVLIGERIHGRSPVGKAFAEGEARALREEARAQVLAGASILDVNVAAPGVDELHLLPRAVEEIQDELDVPLCLDSARPEALAAALKVATGKPLVSSVRAEEDDFRGLLPLVSDSDTSVVGLAMTARGVPPTAAERLELALKIVEAAERYGIPRERVVIDPLALSVGAERESAITTLETCRLVRDQLGVNLTLGLSNVSFGLPARRLLNSAFCILAIEAGVSSFVADASQVRPFVLAADLLLGKDGWARRYTGAFKNGGLG